MNALHLSKSFRTLNVAFLCWIVLASLPLGLYALDKALVLYDPRIEATREIKDENRRVPTPIAKVKSLSEPAEGEGAEETPPAAPRTDDTVRGIKSSYLSGISTNYDNWTNNRDRIVLFDGIASLVAAVFICSAMGSLGAWVSFSQRSQTVPERISLSGAIFMIAFTSSLGLLMMLLLVGKFISGNLFPNFSYTYAPFRHMSAENWAKLMVWCFIAGYSERLIPNILDKIIGSYEKKPSDEPPPGG